MPIVFCLDLLDMKYTTTYEPRREKTGLQGFRPDRTQTGLYNLRKRLEACNFGIRKKRNCTIRVEKTKALKSFAVTAKLICVFVFALAKIQFYQDKAPTTFYSYHFPVLAMAYGPDMNHLVYVGMVGIIDPPRIGVRDAIGMLLEGGVTVKMLTGDSEETAKAIGEAGVNMSRDVRKLVFGVSDQV